MKFSIYRSRANCVCG